MGWAWELPRSLHTSAVTCFPSSSGQRAAAFPSEDSVPLRRNFHVWALGQTFAKKLPHGPPGAGSAFRMACGVWTPLLLAPVLGSPRLLLLASAGVGRWGYQGQLIGSWWSGQAERLPSPPSVCLPQPRNSETPAWLHSSFLYKILFASPGLGGRGTGVSMSSDALPGPPGLLVMLSVSPHRLHLPQAGRLGRWKYWGAWPSCQSQTYCLGLAEGALGGAVSHLGARWGCPLLGAIRVGTP